MNVKLYRRNFTEYAVQPEVNFNVLRYSHHAVGGPKLATIEATGNLDTLFELVNHLREPVEIRNDKGDAVWWGYISGVLVNTAIGSYGVDLENMSNNVAVAYTDEESFRFTTDWSGDAGSIAEYGYKEMLLSKSDVSEADALQTRDVYLSGTKFPTPVLGYSGSKLGTATIKCTGWIETLEWQYYQNLTGKESYEIPGTGGREIGEDDRPKCAQSFQISSATGWDATSIWLKVWYQGDNIPPADSLVVSLKADSGGVPGATLASSTMSYSEISSYGEWLEFVLSSSVTLAISTTYWIEVSRTGGVDPDAFYMVDTNIQVGYPRGVLYLYYTNTGTWAPDAPNDDYGDMIFIVAGKAETTDQVGTLVASAGQFFNGTIIEDDSGLDSNQYRSGDTDGLYELEKFLQAGTTNDRRLLCEATKELYLRVYEEPEKPSVVIDSYALNKDGELLTAALTPTDGTHCAVGIWCHLHDVIPAQVDLSLIGDPTLFFIEEASYDVQNEKYEILKTRDQADVFDLGGVVQG